MMGSVFVLEYFLFTFFASLGTIILAFGFFPELKLKFFTGSKKAKILGAVLVLGAYFWFFSSRNRNVHTVVEGAQLFFIFGLAAVLALLLTKFLARVRK